MVKAHSEAYRKIAKVDRKLEHIYVFLAFLDKSFM